MANKPVKTLYSGTLSLSVWQNETEKGKFYSFTFVKSYKDEEDNWQQTQTLHESDLLVLMSLIQEAQRQYKIKER